uniref:Uncharacterized protein n=1 Tax=Anguilla anguilla TaxID=7936 RepID=A0A0E9U8S1_ANGAN
MRHFCIPEANTAVCYSCNLLCAP